MTAIKNNNTIIIRNTERQSEDVFFNKNKEVEICKLKCVESISHLAAMQF